MMFLQFWIWGAWYISIPGYLQTNGLGDIAFYCYKAIPIGAMIAPFFCGLFADRFINTEKILAILFLIAGATLLAIPYIAGSDIADKEGAIKYAILAHSLAFMPTLALTASLAFTHLKGGSSQFPYVRMFGTWGWIFGAIALMIFNTTAADGTVTPGEKTAGQFWLSGGSSLLLAVFCIFLPKTPAPKKGEKIDLRTLFFMDVWKEFKKPSFAVFVLCSFALCIPLQAYYAYLQNQMQTTGFINYASWKNAGTWIEAGMMFAMPFFFKRLGVKKMIAIGIGAWVLRYALFPIAAGYPPMSVDPTATFSVEWGHIGFLCILGGILLHGICYDFFFVSGQIYVDQATDRKIRGQAQSMIVFFTQGLGMYIGATYINGPLFVKSFEAKDVGEAYGNAANPENLSNWASFWWPLCIVSAVILVVFLIGFHHKDKKDQEFSH